MSRAAEDTFIKVTESFIYRRLERAVSARAKMVPTPEVDRLTLSGMYRKTWGNIQQFFRRMGW